jgi:hypothetical protein
MTAKNENDDKALFNLHPFAITDWQKRLLPLMVFITVGMTVFFLVASMIQLNVLNHAIQNSPKADVTALLANKTMSANERDDLTLRALIKLEENIIERRHHEASVALMARIWTRYMGFIIGMTLAMVGAAFVLGKLNSANNVLNSEMSGIKLNFQSTSPGLVMITLGVILMIVTITNHPKINVVDRAIYVSPMMGGADPASDIIPPALPDWPPVEK